MNAATKRWILNRYLTENNTSNQAEQPTDEALSVPSALDELLYQLAMNHQELIHIEHLQQDESKWKELSRLISNSLNLNTTPATCEPQLTYHQNACEIAKLPKDDYFNRECHCSLISDPELLAMIFQCQNKLYGLILSYPGTTEFNPTDTEEICARISLVENLIQPLSENNPQKDVLIQKATLLKDLNKINQLQFLSIPQDQGGELLFCTLAEIADGATQKISMISLGRIKLQLGALCAIEEISVEKYFENYSDYALITEAILKLPKHGKIEEVQREAMALNISRLLGLTTTTNLMVMFNGQPALFVPFEKIQLLNHYTSGKTFVAGLGLQGKTYTHYSTIKPLGEGIQADQFVHDFGHSLALFYLSSDADAIGGYCQNKALKNANSLFIFDQVMMSEDKFILDSRLSLQPSHFILKHTRHGQGRNKTLIEDSNMIAKYASLIQLQNFNDLLLQYATHTAWIHHHRAQVLKSLLSKELTSKGKQKLSKERSEVIALEKDALLIRSKIKQRIQSIKSLFPRTKGAISDQDIRQSLILEKLIHIPVLFTDDGRPYKNPWTTRQENTIKSITELSSGNLSINFRFQIPPLVLTLIKRQGKINSPTLSTSKTITLSREDLYRLTEDLIYPEHQLQLSAEANYLDLKDLEIIRQAYNAGFRTQIIYCINEYQTTVSNNTASPQELLNIIKSTELKIKEYITTARDKGFGKHVLKKLYYDAQQRMQKLIHPIHLPANINQAFSAALKLDRVSIFHHVVLKAIDQKKLTDNQFSGFLKYCVDKAAVHMNYIEAVEASQALSAQAHKVLDSLGQSVSRQLDLEPLDSRIEVQQADVSVYKKGNNKTSDKEPPFTDLHQPPYPKEETRENLRIRNS